MFATTWNVLQLFNAVVLIVSIGIAAAIKSASRTTIADHVQRVKRIEQTLCSRNLAIADLHIEQLNLCGFLAADWRWGDPTKPLVSLITDNQPPLVIGGDIHPRTECFLGNSKEPFNLESGEQIEQVTWGRGVDFAEERLAARMTIELCDNLGSNGLLGVARFRNLPTIVRNDISIVSIATEQCQAGDEPSDATFIGDFRFDRVFAIGQMLFDIDLNGGLPTAAGSDLLAVDVESHRVVAGRAQPSELSRPFEGLADEVFLVGTITPDP